VSLEPAGVLIATQIGGVASPVQSNPTGETTWTCARRHTGDVLMVGFTLAQEAPGEVAATVECSTVRLPPR